MIRNSDPGGIGFRVECILAILLHASARKPNFLWTGLTVDRKRPGSRSDLFTGKDPVAGNDLPEKLWTGKQLAAI
jgi:hypothetical protein